jgi:hypothetical protein
LPPLQQRLGTQVLAEVVQMHRALVARQAPLSPLDLDHFQAQLQAKLGFVPTVPLVGGPEFQLLRGEFTQVANRTAAVDVDQEKLAQFFLKIRQG